MLGWQNLIKIKSILISGRNENRIPEESDSNDESKKKRGGGRSKRKWKS